MIADAVAFAFKIIVTGKPFIEKGGHVTGFFVVIRLFHAVLLSGQPNSNILAFAKYLDSIGKPVWIRHVVVPGITFDEKELMELGLFLKTLRNVEKLEVLPYHSMGKVKYDNLGMDYVLKDTPQLTKAEAKEAEHIIRAAMEQ